MGKGLNPADEFRRQEKKKELAKSKKSRAAVKEVQALLNDPAKIEAEIQKVSLELEGNKANKSLRDRVVELRRMKEVALGKRRHDAGGGTGTPGTGAGTGTGIGAGTGAREEAGRRPEESVYFHAQFNPSGAPPPGKPPAFRSAPPPPLPSAGPGIPHGMPYTMPYGVPQGMPYGMPYGMGAPQGYGLPFPMPLPLGGVGGIPLPPPRPVPSYTSSAPSMQSHSQHVGGGAPRSSAARPARREATQDDPLDPAAKGYTERFRVPRHSTPVATAAPEVAAVVTVVDTLEVAVEADKEGEQHTEEEGGGEPHKPDVVVGMSGAAFSMAMDVSEILRRRMLVHAEEAGPAAESEDSARPANETTDAPLSLTSMLGGYGSDSDDEGGSGDVERADPTPVSVPAPVPVPALRVIEADPSLLAFVPLSLRSKRAVPSSSLPMLVKRSRPSAETEVLREVDASAHTDALDDEYSDFLREINGLEEAAS